MAKIIAREEFLKLPAGTVAAKFAPMYNDELFISGGVFGTTDFKRQELDQIDSEGDGHLFEMLDDAFHNDAALPMDFDCQSRDGFYDDKHFLILEKADLEGLIARLQRALKEGYDE